jgi:DmsE family decaheme c-type cytochrome
VLLIILTAVLLALGITAVSQKDLPARDPLRESAACLDCHDDKQLDMLGSPHQILESDMNDAEVAIACTDCHLGEKNHYDDDPESYPMSNPATTDATMTGSVCSTCHINSHQQNMGERNSHSENDISCAGCHQVHGSTAAGLLQKEEPELCYQCHTEVRGEFYLPYRHPVSDGIVRCSECHMSLDQNKRVLSTSRIDAACFNCHAEFQGPFPYEHQAALGYSTEEGGCLSCHNAHGSSLPRMLKQPYQGPDYQLCSQCHVVPLHKFNAQHGDQWADVACSDCHADIHGSYISRNFLSPSLRSQGCFNSSCHSF